LHKLVRKKEKEREREREREREGMVERGREWFAYANQVEALEPIILALMDSETSDSAFATFFNSESEKNVEIFSKNKNK
jgi:hypothetical protein